MTNSKQQENSLQKDFQVTAVSETAEPPEKNIDIAPLTAIGGLKVVKRQFERSRKTWIKDTISPTEVTLMFIK